MKAVAVTPDGSRIISGGDDRTARVWDLASGELERTLEVGGLAVQVSSVAVTPDGKRIVSGSDDTVQVWDLASRRPDRIPWKTVLIFISSTFDDMHAERDYLVKRVFPELREWCEKRKLHLWDIDLRWGVREEDTQEQTVVEVCLKRIDDARPFFLCFLGQRRGWVPQEKHISLSTLSENAFPDLKELIGKASVTEMEIIHALVNPFHQSRMKKDQSAEYYERVKYACFYLRESSYLDQLRGLPDLRKVYTNEGLPTPEEQQQADLELERWVKMEIPKLCQEHRRPLHHYAAQWDSKAASPELLLPLASPSTADLILEQWRDKWANAGIKINKGETAITNSGLIREAQEYNRGRSKGRLTDFKVKGETLSQIIIEDLKAAISERYPDHVEVGKVSDLKMEIDQQEQFLAVGSEGFIPRDNDFDELDAYVEGESRQLFVLTAAGGMGKSTLLAKWIEAYRTRNESHSAQSIHFRFIGQSDRSTTVYSLLYFLLSELKEMAGKISIDIPDDPQKLRQELPKLLEARESRARR